MSEIKVILKWKKFDKLEDVLDKTNADDYGVYQILGYHAVFEDDSLLYIGLAKKRSFGARFKEHQDWLKAEADITIYLGRVNSIDDNENYTEKTWRNIIDDVEALLIYYHSPPYNSRCISEPPSNTRLRIINTGDYGSLYPEISHEGLEKDTPAPRPKD